MKKESEVIPHKRFYFEVETKDNTIARHSIRAKDWEEAEQKLSLFGVSKVIAKSYKPFSSIGVRSVYGISTNALL